MSRIDTWDENERALYALGSRAILDDLDRVQESMTADLDRYRDDFTTRQAEQLRAHQDRVRKLEADQAAWLADFIRGETDAPAQDPQDQAVGASADTGSSSPAMPGIGAPGPGQSLTAQDIKAMPMDEYTALRARIGMGNGSGRGLFG